jgi:hypothetical protein
MAPNFKGGIGMIDSDPYGNDGNSWWINQNNFYRQVLNFNIDLTRCAPGFAATGIHWQVAQATTITNVHFRMSTEIGNKHQGIWMENGSGGFMSDLTFNGGKFGIWCGNQQFTSRNLNITNAETGIYMNWNWGWTFKGLYISNCQTGVEMTSGGDQKESVGSITILDAEIKDTQVGVKTVTTANSQPHTGGSLVLDNVRLTNVRAAVASPTGQVFLQGGTKTITSWGQGQVYDQSGKGSFKQGDLPTPQKPKVLLDSHNNIFEKTKPTYLDVSFKDFVSVKSEGAKGDGKTDDTKAIAATLAKWAGCKIVYFPSGTYIVSDTILVPAGSRVVGEIWPTISATGAKFSDVHNPRPVFKIGNAGESGVAELSDLLVSTIGPTPGAILMQINMRDPAGQQGAVGLWDVHFRVGGAKGTNLQDIQCKKETGIGKSECFGAFMLLHLAKTSSAYLENVWAWVADHDIDGNDQISIYNGRGILSESENGPIWMYGTASEHNVLYQYNIVNSKNVFMGMIQTETPYYQSRPKAPLPFEVDNNFYDPNFNSCPNTSDTCAMAWGLRIVNSDHVYVYGAGLYNFFQAYGQGCLATENCQDNMVSIESSPNNIRFYNLNTKASDNMVSIKGNHIKQKDNRNAFCSTIAALL